MWEVIMSVFGAIIGAISQGSANESNINNTTALVQQQHQWAQQAAEKANQETRSQYWDLYSPQSKVQQLKEAGLNPGLMYSSGGLSGSASTAAQAQTPTASAPVINPVANLGEMAQLISSLANQRNAKTQEKQQENQAEETRQNIAESNARIEEIKSKITSSEYQNRLTEMQTKLAMQTAAYTELQTKFENETYEERAKQIKLTNEKTEQEIKEMLEQIKGMEIDNETKGELNRAIIDNYKAQKDQYLQQVEVLKMEKAQKEIQNKILAAQEEREKERLQKELDQMDETIKLTQEYIKTEQEKQNSEKAKQTSMSTSNSLMQLRIANYQTELLLGRAEQIAKAAGVIF